MKNPRYANERGGILIEQDIGRDLYVDSGPIYESAISGKYGQIAEYAPQPEPQPHNDPAPQTVSRFQAKAALHQAGLLTQAEDLIVQADDISKIAWMDATVFRRSSPLVNSIATQIGLTESELDDLFIAASKIEA